MNFDIRPNEETNAIESRIHKQCKEMTSFVQEHQVSLIILAEYKEVDNGIRCSATSSLTLIEDQHKRSILALAGAIADNMMQNQEFAEIICNAMGVFVKRVEQQASQN